MGKKITSGPTLNLNNLLQLLNVCSAPRSVLFSCSFMGFCFVITMRCILPRDERVYALPHLAKVLYVKLSN